MRPLFDVIPDLLGLLGVSRAHCKYSPQCLALLIKQAWVLAAAGIVFSQSGWWLVMASALLAGAALSLLPGRLRPWAAWGCGTFATALLFADLIHLRIFGDLVSVAGLR